MAKTYNTPAVQVIALNVEENILNNMSVNNNPSGQPQTSGRFLEVFLDDEDWDDED